MKFVQIFILVYLKFYCWFPRWFKIFFYTQIIFLAKLIVSNFICLDFLKDFRNFSEYSSIFFFQNFNAYYSKLIPFSNFRCTFSAVAQSFLDILSSFFLQIPQHFFQRFTQSFNKIMVEVCSNFFSGLLKNFLTSFRHDLKFFWH